MPLPRGCFQEHIFEPTEVANTVDEQIKIVSEKEGFWLKGTFDYSLTAVGALRTSAINDLAQAYCDGKGKALAAKVLGIQQIRWEKWDAYLYVKTNNSDIRQLRQDGKAVTILALTPMTHQNGLQKLGNQETDIKLVAGEAMGLPGEIIQIFPGLSEGKGLVISVIWSKINVS